MAGKLGLVRSSEVSKSSNMANGRKGKNRSHEENEYHSHSSHTSQDDERLLPPRGDYQTLLSFQKAEVIYDITFRFAHSFSAKAIERLTK